jgi:WG containing repeat
MSNNPIIATESDEFISTANTKYGSMKQLKLVQFKDPNSDKWGYKSQETGEIVIEPKFDDSRFFNEGLAAVKLYNKWGYINSDGEFQIQPKFDGCGVFNERSAPVIFEGKMGCIKTDGSWFLEPLFDVLIPSEGIASVKLNGKWGYIKTDGTYLVRPRYDFCSDFNRRIANVVLNGERKALTNEGQEFFCRY